MSKVQIIEAELQTLSQAELRQVRAWMDDILDDSSAPQPDFLSRAKSIWGDQPAGKPLSELVAEGRGGGP